MFYTQPRPYWIGPETAEYNGLPIPLGDEPRIKMVISAPGWNNPGADGLAAGIFASFMTYYSHYYGFTLGVFWTVIISLSNLTSGITSVN